MDFSWLLEIIKNAGYVTAVISPIYYLYLYFHLNAFERLLLGTLRNFYINACIVLFTVISFGLLLYSTAQYGLIALAIDMIFYIFTFFTIVAFRKIILFDYQGNQYQILSMTKDNLLIVAKVGKQSVQLLPKSVLIGRDLNIETIFILKSSNITKYHI